MFEVSFRGDVAAGGNLMVCVFGQRLDCLSRQRLHHFNDTERNERKTSGKKTCHNRSRGHVFDWQPRWKLCGRKRGGGDGVIPGLTSRLRSQVERCSGQHLNPFFHACQFWNRQQPLKTGVYSAYKDRGPATIPCHVLYPESSR